jgi:hypothetical protein
VAAVPSSLHLPNGIVARRDTRRFVICLADSAQAGRPALTDTVRRRLDRLGVGVEGDGGGTPDAPTLSVVNHGPRLIWLRLTGRRRTLPDRAASARAFGRGLAWLAPVYRLPGIKGPDALFCAKPDVLLLRSPQGDDAAVDAVARRHKLAEAVERSHRLRRWRCFQLPAGARTTAPTLAGQIRQRAPSVEVDLEYVPWRSPRAFTPGDPMWGTQWGLVRIGAPDAWDIATGDPSVIVAVIDSGCDLDHDELRAAYVSRGINILDPSLDGSPVVDAVSGRQFWHGTAVAGVIAAALDNGIGVAGLAGGVRLLPIAAPRPKSLRPSITPSPRARRSSTSATPSDQSGSRCTFERPSTRRLRPGR